MKLLTPAFAVRAILWVTAASVAFGQGPITDSLVVTFPNTTWVGTQSLPAGKYTIRQLPTASNPRLLEFSSDNGTKLEATVTTIASITNNNRRETSVVLEQKGGQYFLKNVWIEGKTYGYEIPVDDRQQVAGRTERITLAGTFAPNRTQMAANSNPARSTISESSGTPVVPPAPSATPGPTPAAQQPPVVAVVPDPVRDTQSTAAENAGNPQLAPPRTAAAEPTPEAQQPPQTTPRTQSESAENAQLSAQTPPMPQTASHWPDVLLVGILLCAAGMILTPLPVRKGKG